MNEKEIIAVLISLVIGSFLPRLFKRSDKIEDKLDQAQRVLDKLEVKMEFLEKSYAIVHALERDLSQIGKKLRESKPA